MSPPPRTVLITGSSGGIGQALVARFTRAGWKVIGCDRSGKHGALRVDVTDEASVRALAAQLDTPDVLINNAGIGLLGPIVELPDEVLTRQFDVNVRGLARMVRAFAPSMCARGSGRIVNVSSLAGLTSLPWFGTYAATKHAVEALSDALRLELAPFGVDVSMVEPTIVSTGFVDAAMDSLARAAPGSRWEAPLRATLERRRWWDAVTVAPEKVAEVIFRAATARRPRARYRAGALASLLLRVSALLPTPLVDGLLRAGVGLARRPSPLPLTRHTDALPPGEHTA